MFSRQGRSAKRAFLRRQFFRRVRFVVLLPPLDPAGVAAEFPLAARTPFRLELLSAIWTYLRRTRPASPLLQYLLVMVRFPALVAAEPPPPSRPALTLVHHVSARRADVDRYRIIPFGVVIPVTAFIAAVFLPRDVARWDKLFSTV